MCFDFFFNFYLNHFSFQEEIGEVSSQKPLGLHVNCSIFFFDFTSDVSSTDFNKSSKIKFRPIPSGYMRTDGLTADKWDSKLKF